MNYFLNIVYIQLNELLRRLQEHGQVGKIILNPTATRESTEEPDYYAIAEKNVKKRIWDQKPFLNKLGLPEPGELVRDKSLVEIEKERAKEKEQEEMQEKLQQQQQFHDQEMRKKMMEQQQFQERGTMPQLFSKGNETFFRPREEGIDRDFHLLFP